MRIKGTFLFMYKGHEDYQDSLFMCPNSCYRTRDKRKHTSATDHARCGGGGGGRVASCFYVWVAHMADVANCPRNFYLQTARRPPYPCLHPRPTAPADGTALPTPPPTACPFQERSSPPPTGRRPSLQHACSTAPAASFPSLGPPRCRSLPCGFHLHHARRRRSPGTRLFYLPPPRRHSSSRSNR
jgi:hypothetical protein